MFEGRCGAGQGALGWEAGRTVDRGAGAGQAPKEQGFTPVGAQSTPPRFPSGSRGELRESSGISEFTWDQTPHNNLNDQWASFFNFEQNLFWFKF